jgi:hypothetical protein
MADLGYVDFYEALSIYQYLDPATVRIDERSVVAPPPETPTELPAVLAGAVDEAGFFARALGTIAATADVERLQAALVLLLNKAMAADLVEPGDTEAGRRTLVRVVAYLGIGLEYLGRGDTARAGQALATVALERVFRVGVSLTLQLKALGDTLVKQGGVNPITLDSPWDDVLRALRQRRPDYPRALDEPPAEGTRPFLTLADVGRGAAAIERITKLPTRE